MPFWKIPKEPWNANDPVFRFVIVSAFSSTLVHRRPLRCTNHDRDPERQNAKKRRRNTAPSLFSSRVSTMISRDVLGGPAPRASHWPRPPTDPKSVYRASRVEDAVRAAVRPLARAPGRGGRTGARAATSDVAEGAMRA